MSTAKKFAGQTAIYGLTTIISRSLYFILTPIFTRMLPTSVYGIFTAMYSYASVINPILAFGMETTFFRYLNKRADQKDEVYNNAFGVVLLASVVFLMFCLLFLNPIINYLQVGNVTQHADYVFYVKCFLAILMLDAICVIPFAKVRANGRPVRYAFVKCTNILIVFSLNLFFLFGVPFIITNHFPGAHWMAGWYRQGWVGYVFLSNTIASIATMLMLLPEMVKFRWHFDRSMYLDMFLYSWPILVANLSYIINENLDKLMLKHMLPYGINDRDVGIYGACAKISLFLSIFVNAFRLGAEPFFFSHAKNKNARDTYARIMTYFVIAVSVIFVALTANIDLLGHFVLGAQSKLVNRHVVVNPYWSGIGVVPPLLFGYVSLGIYMNLSVWYKLSDQTKYGLYISGIGALLTIVLNYLFIPQYSYMASAWVSLIAYATMMVLSYVWGQKNYPIPYHLVKNLAYIIGSIIIVVLSFYVFNRNIFIGNALLAIFALITFVVERKELMLILKRK